MKEAQNIEWKETWRDELLRWVCGFANAEGGRLHIGRNNRVEVVGVANAARLLTVARLLKPHPSCPFNPGIANAFFRAGEIEAWGRGIQLITDACREAGTPAPKIESEAGDLWIEFPFAPEYLETISATAEKTRVKTRVKTPEQILEILRQQPAMTLIEVAAEIGKSVSAVERAAQKLSREGRLRYVGPRKGGHWEVIE